MTARRTLAWVGVIMLAAAGIWLLFNSPEDKTRSTYKGPHGTVFVQFDVHHRGVRYGVKDSAADVTAIMVFPNGTRGYCHGACVFDGYWKKLIYRDKNGERDAVINRDAATNVFPSP